MTFNIIQSNVYTTIASSLQPLTDFEFPLDTQLQIFNGNWYFGDTIVIEMITRFAITIVDPDRIKYVAFRNPLQLTAGYAAFTSEEFVVKDTPLKWLNQQERIEFAPIHLAGSKSGLPARLGNTGAQKAGHAYSVGSTLICGITESEVVPAPAPSFGKLSAEIPPAALCLKVHVGQMEFVELNPFDDFSLNALNINVLEAGAPDKIQGVLGAGLSMECTVTYGYSSATNENAPSAIAPLVIGPAPLPVYGYACSLGIPVPAPTNPPCSPGDEIIIFTPTGQQILCQSNTN